MWCFLFVIALSASVNAKIHSPPHIIKQPSNDEMLYQVSEASEFDKPLLIECVAEGEPAPKYRWIKNGKPFDWLAHDDRMIMEPGRGTLIVSRPKEEDEGQYQCFAENEHGIALSNSVYLRKTWLNDFDYARPKSLEGNQGKPFKLQCQPPDGWPKPHVFWLIQKAEGGSIKTINNSRITLDPEGNLWFSNLTRMDISENFYYACAASSQIPYDYKIGKRISLQVIASGISPSQNRQEPVKQYVSRKNEVALRGKKIEIYCIYGGTPLPLTVWKKNGILVEWSGRIKQGNFGKSLIIEKATFEDEGEYICEISNGVGSTQYNSINLKIESVPYFTVEPEVQNAEKGETVEFHCEANGFPEPTIIWIHNGKPIEQAPTNSRRIVTTNKIVINNLEEKDTGNYGCNATNALGYVYKDVYLNVLSLSPEITEFLSKIATVDNRDVTLTCRVFGVPKPKVKWIRNGVELIGGHYITQVNGDLLIKNVQFLDAGEYICHAENKFGTKQANVYLSVKKHTQISEVPMDYEVAAPTSATFRCDVVVDPSLNLIVDWLHNGEVIDFDSQPRFFKSSDFSLTISNTNERDSGIYTCVAKTELDNASASATLTVQDVPTLQSVYVSCNSQYAKIYWGLPNDNPLPVLFYTIQYNTSFAPDTWENVATDIPATESYYKFAMSPWTNYTFRVIAHNKIGPSDPIVHNYPCTTQPDVPHKNPEHVEGKGTEPNNLIIKWTPMKEIDHNAPDFHYRISYKQDVPGTQYITQDIFDWQQSELIVLDTPTFAKYKIKVQALNEKGESNVAVKEIEGYSGEDKPLEAPQNLTLNSIHSGTSALLQWDAVDSASVRGHFRGYKIQTWTHDNKEDIKEVEVKSGATKSLVTKLTPYSKNYARIMVYNDRFNGPPSNIIEIDTPEGAPGPVKNIEAFPLGSSAFLLKWEPPLLPNGIIKSYKIHYAEINGAAVDFPNVIEKQVTDPKENSAKLSGLKPYTKYRLYVTANTNESEGEINYIEAYTGIDITLSFEVQNLAIENRLANLKVKMLPNVNNVKTTSYFYVNYRQMGEDVFMETEHEFFDDTIELRGLELNEQYEFRVVFVDGEYSTKSETKIVSTAEELFPPTDEIEEDYMEEVTDVELNLQQVLKK